jgi:hypothetical protein
MAASMVTSIAGWTGLLPRALAYGVGGGVQGFILFFSILLVNARTRSARLPLLLALSGFALCLSVPFSWVAILAGNAKRADAAGAGALEAHALQTATARFVAEGNTVRGQVLTNIANARAWLGRAGTAGTTAHPPPATPPKGRITVEEVPPTGTPAPTQGATPAVPSAPEAPTAPPPTATATATEAQVQRRYLDTLEAEWQALPLDPGLAAAESSEAGWQHLNAAYGRLMVAWGRTRRYLRTEVPLPAVPARPVSGYDEAAAGAADPINRSFYRLLHAPRPADWWFLLLTVMLDAAPIWAAYTLSLVTPPAPNGAGHGDSPFDQLREDLGRIEERLSESGPGPSDWAHEDRDAKWDFALGLSVQRLFLDALDSWWQRLSDAIERSDADPALETELRSLRDRVLAEEGATPLTHLRQARWLLEARRQQAILREAKEMETGLLYLGPEALEAAKRQLAALLGP